MRRPDEGKYGPTWAKQRPHEGTQTRPDKGKTTRLNRRSKGECDERRKATFDEEEKGRWSKTNLRRDLWKQPPLGVPRANQLPNLNRSLSVPLLGQESAHSTVLIHITDRDHHDTFSRIQPTPTKVRKAQTN